MNIQPQSILPRLHRSVEYFVELAIWLVPLFFLASFLVGIIEEYVPPARMQSFLGQQSGGAGIVAGASGGALTPFCSCASIPVAAGLLQAGTPLSIAVVFLLASPLINEVAILLLVGLFSIKTAAAYVLLTFVSIVTVGYLVEQTELQTHVTVQRAHADEETDESRDDAQCSTGNSRGTHREHAIGAARRAGAFFREMSPYLLFGLVVGAALHGFVPTTWIRGVLGANNPLAVPVAALAGAPVYVSLSAVLPIASSLGQHGVPVGTLLAFVIGGAGVSIPNLVMLSKLFDRYLLGVYILTVLGIGMTVGLIFNVGLPLLSATASFSLA